MSGMGPLTAWGVREVVSSQIPSGATLGTGGQSGPEREEQVVTETLGGATSQIPRGPVKRFGLLSEDRSCSGEGHIVPRGLGS